MDTKGKTILHFYTAEFPFGKSESIIENELPIISKHFNNVFIRPLHLKDNIQREIPQNAILLESVGNRKNMNSKSIFVRHFFFIAKILCVEFLHCPQKSFFLKRIRLFNSMLIRAIFDASTITPSKKATTDKEIYYSYWMNDWALALSVLKAKKRINHFVFRCGGFDIYDERHENNYLPFRYTIYKYCSAIYPNSQNAMDYISSKDYFKHKVKLTYLGTIDGGINRFDSQSTFTIVSCSSTIPLKRVHLIIDILKNINFDLNWIHFGGGVSFDEIKEKASVLPSNINYNLKGNTKNKDIIDFYKNNSVNLFITTSETESLPVSIQEAISFGIPIIATNVGGMCEIVNEHTGFLIDKNVEVFKVAELIINFKRSNKNTEEFRKGIRDFWMANFDASKNYEEFFEEIIQYS